MKTARSNKPAPTLEQLVALDPRIGLLLRDAGRVKDDGGPEGFCANLVFYTRFKPRVMALVGWERQDGPAELRTPYAYDLVYDAIYEKMPDCRRCLCL
jgi:hypothetical protein